jgi:serine/threonine protein kinase
MAGPGSDVRIPETPARRFRTGDRRNEGRTGVSFFGTDPELNTPVVVKVLRASAFASPLERQRIVRELKRQVSVPHPSLARVIAADDEGGVVWVARDWIEGRPLSERIATGSISTEEAARWTSQLAEALGELHRVMLLHRDVRPDHVILALDGRARLIDASCGRHFRSSDGKAVFGTPGYVAPEAIAGKLVNARSDLYSLGATAYAMLQGASPFGEGNDSSLLERAAKSDAPKATRGPEGFISAVASLLAREPRERPFHAQQVCQLLEPFFTATRTAAAADDSDGPPTAAVDESMVSKAIAMLPGPSIVDDEFDDAEVTEVAKNTAVTAAREAPAVPSKSAGVSPPPPTGNTGAVRVPAPSHNTGAHAVAVAPSSAPAMAMGQPAQSVIRKATLMGMAPLAQQAATPVLAPPVAPVKPQPTAVASAPSTDSQHREDSGSRRHSPTDFDDDENTVVSEDSRIFGHSEPHAQSAYGSAVPPLPDDVSKRVLQKGGTVSAPVEARPLSVPPPPPQRKVTGSIRAPAPPSVPTLPHPEMHAPVEYTPTPETGGGPTMTANVAAVAAFSDMSGPNAPVDPQNISVTEPSGAPTWDNVPPAVAPPAVHSHSPQYQGVQQGALQSQPGVAQTYAPPHAQTGHYQAPAGYPPAQGQGAPMGPQMGGYPQQQGPYPTGGYPSPHSPYGPQQPTGAYASPQGTGAYPAPHPGMTAGWAEAPPKKGALWPWIAAGCLIALVAGGTGYALALRHRTDPTVDVQIGPGPNIATPTNTTNTALPVGTNTAANAGTNNTANNGVVAPNNAGAAINANVAPDVMVVAMPVAVVDSGVAMAVNNVAVPNNNGAVALNTNIVAPPPNNAQTPPNNAQTQTTPRTNTAPTLSPVQQARQLNGRRDYVGARAILKSWVRSHPTDAQALLLLGDVRFSQGERRPAGDAYRSAIAAGGYGRTYWQRLVDRQLSIGDRQGAINTLNDVLRHRPGDRDATRKLAELQGGGSAPARPAASSAVPAFGAPRPGTIRR